MNRRRPAETSPNASRMRKRSRVTITIPPTPTSGETPALPLSVNPPPSTTSNPTTSMVVHAKPLMKPRPLTMTQTLPTAATSTRGAASLTPAGTSSKALVQPTVSPTKASVVEAPLVLTGPPAGTASNLAGTFPALFLIGLATNVSLPVASDDSETAAPKRKKKKKKKKTEGTSCLFTSSFFQP